LLLVGYFFMLFLWSLSALHAVVVTNPLFSCLLLLLLPVNCCLFNFLSLSCHLLMSLLLSPSLHRQLPMLLELPCEAIATAPAWGCACTVAKVVTPGLIFSNAIPPVMAAPMPRHLVLHLRKRIPLPCCDTDGINCLYCDQQMA